MAAVMGGEIDERNNDPEYIRQQVTRSIHKLK